MANNTLTKQEQEELFRLGEDIQAGLSCDVNGTGIPCRTDRLDAVENMKRYLEIHDYICLLYTSPSPRDGLLSRMPSSA